MADVPAWVAVATAAITAASGLGAEGLRGLHARRTAEGDRAAQQLRRQQEQRDDFYRETLLALQDAYVELGQRSAKAYFALEREYKEKRTWYHDLLPDEIGGEASLLVGREFNRLAQRVLDDDFRALLLEYRSVSNRVGMPTMTGESYEDARSRSNAAWLRMANLSAEVEEALGAALRQLFQPSAGDGT